MMVCMHHDVTVCALMIDDQTRLLFMCSAVSLCRCGGCRGDHMFPACGSRTGWAGSVSALCTGHRGVAACGRGQGAPGACIQGDVPCQELLTQVSWACLCRSCLVRSFWVRQWPLSEYAGASSWMGPCRRRWSGCRVSLTIPRAAHCQS